MTRFVIEEPCSHGFTGTHRFNDNGYTYSECSNGKRRVFEGIPDELVERGAKALVDHGGMDWHNPYGEDDGPDEAWRNIQRAKTRAVLEAVFE